MGLMLNNKGTNKSNQLCWNCNKCFGGCSWAESLTPVEGWTAEPMYIIRGTERVLYTYGITACPEFEEEKPRSKDDYDEDGLVNCLIAYFELAAEDYRRALRAEKIGCATNFTRRDKLQCELALPRHIARAIRMEVENE